MTGKKLCNSEKNLREGDTFVSKEDTRADKMILNVVRNNKEDPMRECSIN